MERNYTCRRLGPGDDLSDALAVRINVFIDEQGFDPRSEEEELDLSVHHIVLYDGDKPIATGRVFPAEDQPGVYTLGRICVLKDYRGGTGSLLMEKLEELAGELGATAVELGAQCRVQDFYKRFGYEPYGEVYYDEFCPHIHMRHPLGG